MDVRRQHIPPHPGLTLRDDVLPSLGLTVTQAAWRFGEGLPAATDVASAAFWAADAGHRVARYDKVHLFSFETGRERYDESATIEAGNEALALQRMDEHLLHVEQALTFHTPVDAR